MQYVLGANRPLHLRGHDPEHDVARQVSVRVVHLLEVIEVEEHEAERRLVPVRVGHLGREPLDEVLSIVDFGERVLRGRFVELVRELLLGFVQDREANDDVRADLDAVTGAQLGALDAAPTDERAVRGAQVLDLELPVHRSEDPRVRAGDAHVLDAHLHLAPAADRRLVRVDREHLPRVDAREDGEQGAIALDDGRRRQHGRLGGARHARLGVHPLGSIMLGRDPRGFVGGREDATGSSAGAGGISLTFTSATTGNFTVERRSSAMIVSQSLAEARRAVGGQRVDLRLRDLAGADDRAVDVGARALRAHGRGGVNRVKPEVGAVAVGPLEVVEERPVEVAEHVVAAQVRGPELEQVLAMKRPRMTSFTSATPFSVTTMGRP